MKDKRITIRLESETFDNLNDICNKHNVTVSKLVRKMINNFLYKYEK